MQDARYSIITVPHFDRLLKKLARKHSDLIERFEEAITILSIDPYNKAGRCNRALLLRLRGLRRLVVTEMGSELLDQEFLEQVLHRA